MAANRDVRYLVSKLLEVFYTRELATRTQSNNKIPVIINYLTPGLCHSGLSSREENTFLEIMKYFLARSTEVGSRCLVHAAEANEETHGQYLRDCQITA